MKGALVDKSRVHCPYQAAAPYKGFTGFGSKTKNFTGSQLWLFNTDESLLFNFITIFPYYRLHMNIIFVTIIRIKYVIVINILCLQL